MPTAAVNGQQINYADTGGDGPAILWSHGFLMDHTMFGPQIDALKDDYRCITWDERGFGTTPATEPFTYWDSANDAIALLDHLGIDQAVLAGMSQGGFLSMRAALTHPDRVRALILIDTKSSPDDEETNAGYEGMLAHWRSDAPLGEVGEFVASLVLGTPELSAEWIAKWEERRGDFTEHVGRCLLDREDISDRVAEISAPTLVIHGDADAAIALADGQRLADTIPNATMVVMPGGSHSSNLTNPDETNTAIGAFLATLS